MSADPNLMSGLVLMLVLGLRHGLDPDHIAIIDGLSLRMAEQRPRWAGWTGTFFALGHGCVVTLVAVAVSLGASRLNIPAMAYAIAEWVPIVMLTAVGLSNLRGLLRKEPFRARGVIARWLPLRVLNVSHPLGVVLVGVLFALVFDTITQAAAWGYIATQQGGVTAAAIAGLVFTAGMIVTDTLDSQVLCRLLRTGTPAIIERRQRMLGWVIVVLSLGVVLYGLMQRIWPTLEMGDAAYTTVGILSLLALVVIAVYTRTTAPRLSAGKP